MGNTIDYEFFMQKAMRTVAKQAIEFGAYDYVSKPFDLQYLKDNLLERIFS